MEHVTLAISRRHGIIAAETATAERLAQSQINRQPIDCKRVSVRWTKSSNKQSDRMHFRLPEDALTDPERHQACQEVP
jgi:hypothetical protein